MTYQVIKPVIDYAVRDLCQRPYPGHKKGCPNYGKKMGCPPHASRFENLIDLNHSIYAIFNNEQY